MYQALYRKWRPKTFADVCGQEHVTKALKNELQNNRLSHAYLFTGCRGTGKTTCAKILAKAVNCEHPVEGDPCGECVLCQGIDDGSVLDVTEIDAASNNGVDNIRELRDEVAFTPVKGKYRVYIIDEVHMLSPGAFNALLKTLEEPPAHVIFILATTEVHKLPATILSRCQRFDFNRIRPEVIADRVTYVAQQEGLSITPDAALLLARLADGAMRDALSLLDQCAGGHTEITAKTVTEVTGIAGQDALADLTQAVIDRNCAGGLEELDRLYRAGKDMERLCGEWVAFMRNLMVLKNVKNPGDLILAAPEDLTRMEQLAKGFPMATLLHCMTVLQMALDRLHGGVSRRVEMEMTVLRLCDPALDDGSDALLRRIETLENAVRSGVAPVQKPAKASVSAETPAETPAVDMPAKKPADETPTPPAEESASEEAPAPAPVFAAAEEVPFSRWGEVLECLRRTCMPLAGVLADSEALLQGDKLIVCTDNALFKQIISQDENRDLLKNAVRDAAGVEILRLGLRHHTPVSTQKEDPLAQLLQNSRNAGVPIEEK